MKTTTKKAAELECERFIASRSEVVNVNILKALESAEFRWSYIEKFGFAIPCKDALEAIATYAPVLEVGAGSGYWAYELQRMGVDVVATDPGVGKYRGNEKHWENMWTSVTRATGQDAVKRYPDRSLLTVWPDYRDEWPSEVLKVYQGDVVIYVGEESGGCTGDDEFHDILALEFQCVDSVGIPQFLGIHDALTIYQRLRPI